MGALEIVIIIAAAALVIFTIVFNLVRKRKGKSGCGGACSGCAYSRTCNPENEREKEKDTK